MTTLSFTLEINEFERSLLEHLLSDLEKEYRADPANELSISLGRKSRYELFLDKIKNSKISVTSTSSFVEQGPIIINVPKTD